MCDYINHYFHYDISTAKFHVGTLFNILLINNKFTSKISVLFTILKENGLNIMKNHSTVGTKFCEKY